MLAVVVTAGLHARTPASTQLASTARGDVTGFLIS
jgi:hypothetical protein